MKWCSKSRRRWNENSGVESPKRRSIGLYVHTTADRQRSTDCLHPLGDVRSSTMRWLFRMSVFKHRSSTVWSFNPARISRWWGGWAIGVWPLTRHVHVDDRYTASSSIRQRRSWLQRLRQSSVVSPLLLMMWPMQRDAALFCFWSYCIAIRIRFLQPISRLKFDINDHYFIRMPMMSGVDKLHSNEFSTSND